MLLPLERGQGFVGEVARAVAEGRKNWIDNPRLDLHCFPGATRYHPPSVRQFLQGLHERSETINEAAALFDDEESRQLLKRIFVYRALGPRHVPLLIDDKEFDRYMAAAAGFRTETAVADVPPLGAVDRFSVKADGHSLHLDCWVGNVATTFFERQYWFERNGVTIAPQRGDVVIDAGACFGETALAFAIAAGDEGQVHSFEPIPLQRVIFEENLTRNPDIASRIRVHDFALGDRSGEKLRFSDGGAAARASDEGPIEVTTMSIDDLVERENLPKVDFIKMDIEGAEPKAIEGAAKTLKRFKPRLGISIYHQPEHLTDIPRQIKAMVPEYRLYLDHHSLDMGETVLYAI